MLADCMVRASLYMCMIYIHHHLSSSFMKPHPEHCIYTHTRTYPPTNAVENLASVGSTGSALQLSKEEEGEVTIVHVELLGKPYNISVRYFLLLL